MYIPLDRMGVRSLFEKGGGGGGGGGGGRILLIGDLNYNNIYFECYFHFVHRCFVRFYSG